MHVDDGFFASSLITDERYGTEVDKIVGYEPTPSPAGLGIPADRQAATAEALLALAARDSVDIELLRSVIGIWVWETLLFRDLLSIAHSVFQFMTRYEGRVARWWPSARSEVRAMAHTIIFLRADLGAPLSPYLFATDAQGASDEDAGGFGIVGAFVGQELAQRCFETGPLPAKTVVKLDGDVNKLLGHRSRALQANVPLTPLPPELFDPAQTRWEVIVRGRWRLADRIELGEARATLRLLHLLAVVPSAHRHVIQSLEDNSSWGGAAAKGRSPSPALNYLCRRKAAVCAACRFRLILPWVQSAVMPADEASRTVGPCGVHLVG